MGTYYQFTNYDKHEVISCSSLFNIKYGNFSQWSPQQAILNVFLGFSFYRSGLKTDEWTGRWAKNRVCLESDASTHESDDWDNEVDAGEQFCVFLMHSGQLRKFIMDVCECSESTYDYVLSETKKLAIVDIRQSQLTLQERKP